MVAKDISTDAQREILLNWHKLSPGDLSIIHSTLAKRDSNVMTSPDSPHWYFWTQLAKLEWARKVVLPSEMAANAAEIAVQFAIFELTDLGRDLLPKFIDYRKLYEVTPDNKIVKTNKVYTRVPPDAKGEAAKETSPSIGIVQLAEEFPQRIREISGLLNKPREVWSVDQTRLGPASGKKPENVTLEDAKILASLLKERYGLETHTQEFIAVDGKRIIQVAASWDFFTLMKATR